MNNQVKNLAKITSQANPKRYLRRRLLILLTGMILVTLLVIGSSVFYFISQNEQRTWQGRQGEAARHAAETVDTFLLNTEQTLNLVGLLDNETQLMQPEVLDGFLTYSPALLEIVRVDAQGNVLATTDRDKPLLSSSFTIPQSRWFTQSKAGETYLSNVQISTNSEPYLIISVPASDGGVVAGRLQMNVLWNVVSNLTFGETGQAYVVNQDGEIVAHTEPEVALNRTTLAGRPEMMGLTEASDHRWSGTYPNFKEIEVVGITVPLADTDWVVITELAEEEAFDVSRTASLLIGGGMIIFALVMLLVTGQFLSNLILKPMEQLRAGAVQVGQDEDLHYQIDLERNDEMGQVAEAFNEMVRRLRQRKAEIAERTRALQESEERFRQVITSIQPHIYMTEITPEGDHINRYLSPNIELLTGYPRETFMADWSFWPSTVIHPEHRAAATRQVDRLTEKKYSEIEYQLVKSNGDTIWVMDSARVEQGLDEQSLIVYGVISDITRRKQSEQALREARDQALEASRLKTQLLANVSHDLRTPLNAILGYTEMLQEGVYGPMSDDQQEAMAEIIDSTGELLNFINNLLDQAQIKAGKLALNVSPFTPSDLLDNLQSALGVVAHSKGLALTGDVAPDVPDTLWGDPHRIQQVLGNLISNALKFTEEGSVHVGIYQPNPEHWAVAVTDTGPGIPPEAQSYIFEAFRQVDGSETRAHATGSGLGLSIVAELTHLMGGEVTLTSQEGQGSTFTINLPFQAVKEPIV